MTKFDSAYKSIGEVAKILDLINKKKGSLNTHTIRYWEKEFKNINPKIFAGKRRYYNAETIDLLKQIKYLLSAKRVFGALKIVGKYRAQLFRL